MELSASSIQSDEVMDSDPIIEAMLSAPISPSHLASITPLAEPGRCRFISSRTSPVMSSLHPKTTLSISRCNTSGVRATLP